MVSKPYNVWQKWNHFDERCWIFRGTIKMFVYLSHSIVSSIFFFFIFCSLFIVLYLICTYWWYDSCVCKQFMLYIIIYRSPNINWSHVMILWTTKIKKKITNLNSNKQTDFQAALRQGETSTWEKLIDHSILIEFHLCFHVNFSNGNHHHFFF